MFFVFSFCKKNSSSDPISTPLTPTNILHDTIFPMSYFPVYPGSNWKYNYTGNFVLTYSTESTYQKDYYDIDCKTSDTVYVPIYNHYLIWGYSLSKMVRRCFSHTAPFELLLSETIPVGQKWSIAYTNPSQQGAERKVLARDTTIKISGISYYPTIVMEDAYANIGPAPFLYGGKIRRTYYTKNIGIVKEEYYDYYKYKDSVISTLEILDYFINKP